MGTADGAARLWHMGNIAKALRHIVVAAVVVCAASSPVAFAELIRREGYRNDGTQITGSVTIDGKTQVVSGKSGHEPGSWEKTNACTWSHFDESGNCDGVSTMNPSKVATGHWEWSGTGKSRTLR